MILEVSLRELKSLQKICTRSSNIFIPIYFILQTNIGGNWFSQSEAWLKSFRLCSSWLIKHYYHHDHDHCRFECLSKKILNLKIFLSYLKDEKGIFRKKGTFAEGLVPFAPFTLHKLAPKFVVTKLAVISLPPKILEVLLYTLSVKSNFMKALFRNL